ncbi:Translocation-associated membrane protein 1 [Fasciola hepatica]|uniref:Translocation-associated membrane protein 1 n=1 Tax=Fasciola hepatica TaxID=6192 RepID=A0A4E0RVR3_FASHE|nr:Translocation-associated membrane protein 1 [Fasciola hepatica]
MKVSLVCYAETPPDHPERPPLYSPGKSDLCVIFFYTLIFIVAHAVLQEYVFDVVKIVHGVDRFALRDRHILPHCSSSSFRGLLRAGFRRVTAISTNHSLQVHNMERGVYTRENDLHDFGFPCPTSVPVVDLSTGNFNTVTIRMASMAFLFISQAFMVWNFITFHQRRRRDRSSHGASKSWFSFGQDSSAPKKKEKKKVSKREDEEPSEGDSDQNNQKEIRRRKPIKTRPQ